MNKDIQMNNPVTKFLLYKSPDGEIKIDVLLQDTNLWLPQKKIAELFGVNTPAISKHFKKIFEEWELNRNSTVSILETVQNEDDRSVKRKVEFYNLDAIIAVWYRVNSKKATMFRIWANKVIKDYIIKWFVMNDERLKNPTSYFGKDYFEEQLERIRDINGNDYGRLGWKTQCFSTI